MTLEPENAERPVMHSYKNSTQSKKIAAAVNRAFRSPALATNKAVCRQFIAAGVA